MTKKMFRFNLWQFMHALKTLTNTQINANQFENSITYRLRRLCAMRYALFYVSRARLSSLAR